ncbi:MAG: glycerol-3-phosphate 1-O-acyltransferase PlsY [Oscillospiraceae bacterium]|nr:glycerol-3-phosphate 1-O-acyltransferase PlsY [Oscillospiraceae bacterium]
MTALSIVLTAIVSYLFGSVSFAILVGYLFLKKDIRTVGSGNAGTTNVLRNCGKVAAGLCALGDLLKGILPVLAGKMVFAHLGLPPVYGAYLAGFCAVLGHLFPIFFRFKGGKGVMTSAAVMLVIDPIATLIGLVIFIVVTFTTRYVSVGSITVAFCYPFATYFVNKISGNPLALSIAGCAAVFAVLVIYMHRSNIQRLINGTENRFGKKKGN